MNAYHELLGIPPREQPPHHYRLLGISLFEADSEVISNAARRQVSFLRPLGGGPYSRQSQELLNEVTAAKLCLLDPKRRADYDRRLREQQQGSVLDAPEAEQASADLEQSHPSLAAFHLPQSGEADQEDLSGQSWHLLSNVAEHAARDKCNAHEWVVGSGDQADIQVHSPSVSRQHCRVSRENEAFYLEDLGSKNGTYVNEVSVVDKVPIVVGDIITLGNKIRLPWPLPDGCESYSARVFTIGRAPDSDLVIDDSSVSKYHAQLVIANDAITLYDLDSTNGTCVGLVGNRVHQCQLEPHLSYYFGSRRFTGAELAALSTAQ